LSRVLERSFNLGHAAPVTTMGGVNESRLRQVVSDHFEVLWRFLRRLGIADGDTDDAAQEVVLVLARKLDHVEVGAERSFVLSTAFRVASGFRRAARRRREVEDGELSDFESPELGPEALAEKQRLRVVLQRVLNELPLELRAVFVLYELEELTMAEIAATLELPPGTVASRLRRAREQFETLASCAGEGLAS
jgi:RNA polymerase sigma-70 factor, ECF subfamily